MIVKLDDGGVALTAQTDAERDVLAAWMADGESRLLLAERAVDGSIRLSDAARAAAAPDEPINIAFGITPMPWQLIANLAPTPFELDRRRYASIEGFWQGLKFTDEVDRQRIAVLSGPAAKAAGRHVEPGEIIIYDRRKIVVGTVEHWALMERACAAKFEQHDGAREALLSTAPRRLEHKVKVDSRTIPGIVMADIWTRIRAQLLAQ